MATGIPFGWQVENGNGTPVSGAKVYFYQPGTTTPRSAYTDDGLAVPASNPVIADSAGWFNVYLSSELGYDIVIKSADDSITYQERTTASSIENAQPVDATLTMLAGLAGTNGDSVEFTGTDTGRVRKLFVATKSALKAISSPTSNDRVLMQGRTSAGDGGGGPFRWVTGDQSANVTADTLEDIWVPLTGEDGTTGAWKREYSGPVRVEWFGAVPYAIGTATTSMTDSAAAFNAAITMAGIGGKVVYQPKWYRLTDGLVQLEGQVLECEGGVTDWENADFRGGLLIFDGTGPTDYSFALAISECANSGGVVTNPSDTASLTYLSSSGTNLDSFKLHDFTDQDTTDETPATAKTFSAAIKMARYSQLVNVVVTNDKGGDIANHQTLDGNLGDDWDVGILAHNADNWSHTNVRTQGNFRIAGFLLVSCYDGDADTGYNGTPIANQGLAINSRYNGHTGFMARAPDIYLVTAVTSTYIEIPWDSSHMFPATGTIAFANAGSTTYSYTAVAKVSDKLRFTMSSDPSGDFSVNDLVRDGRNAENYGYDGTRFIGCRFSSLIARSYMSTDTAYGFDRAGGCIQISGKPMRGIDFIGCTFDTREDVMAHFHQAGDIVFNSCYFEGKSALKSSDSSSISAGAYWIGLNEDENGATYAAGGTENVSFVGRCQWGTSTITRKGAYTQGSDVATRHSGIATGLFNPDQLIDDVRRIGGTTTFGDAIRYRGGAFTFVDNDDNTTTASVNSSNEWGFGASPSTGYDFTTGDASADKWDVGGGATTDGSTNGKSIEPTNIKSSRNGAGSVNHVVFYNPNGTVGSISTNASATAYNTTSDETLKEFTGALDPKEAYALIKADPAQWFNWLADGSVGLGWGAQTSYRLSPDLATPGGWVDAEGNPVSEGTDGAMYQPWSMELARRVPWLWAGFTGLMEEVDELKEEIERLKVER